MNLAGHDIGICSWSLSPTSVDDLIRTMGELKLSHVHLSIGPLMGLDEAARKSQIDKIIDADITITAGQISFPGEDYSTIPRIRNTGGFVPDDLWPERREIIGMATAICREFGIKMLSAHVGFIPLSSGERYKTMVDRVSELVTAMEKEGVSLLMETGQEQASELLQFINDVHGRNAYVNFDAANMLLYGAGDPVEAVSILGRHIRHVHVKDAKESDQPGMNWGKEVLLGTGGVPLVEVLKGLRAEGYRGPLVIEREEGGLKGREGYLAIEALRGAMAGVDA
jgi:sugar phosphate isomerase/epimerase